jgi:hypothetical protein
MIFEWHHKCKKNPLFSHLYLRYYFKGKNVKNVKTGNKDKISAVYKTLNTLLAQTFQEVVTKNGIGNIVEISDIFFSSLLINYHLTNIY